MNPRHAALTVTLLFAACGTEHVTVTQRSSLEGSFESAAAEYQVPVGVLKSIAYVETRLSQNAGIASMTKGYGLMNLVEREDWNSLQRASQLTGLPVARLKLDPDANIRGAAAVLRELADRAFAQYRDLNPTDPADYWHAVSLYAGLLDASSGIEYAREVYLTLERGFHVDGAEGSVRQSSAPTQWRRHLPRFEARQDLAIEYPGAARWVASPNYTAGRTDYTYVVIHTTQGQYSGAVSWLSNPVAKVSAHYVVRSVDGYITQMVEHRNTAWHAQCYNKRSIGIEHEGFVADPGKWYTPAMYSASAKLTRWIADRHAIPRNRSRIVGHVEVAPECNTGRHTDPGSGWNWTHYMNLVNGTTSTPTSGKLTGVIYQGGNTANRVAGALVKVNGATQTTGTEGTYEFVLNPGTYTVSVEKAGYSSASLSRVVTAGAPVWGSMQINPVAATGKLKGKVYAFKAANPSDLTQVIPGATVVVNGSSKTVGSDGYFEFVLPPGTYTVNASAAGYQSSSLSRAVTANADVWGSVGLSLTAAPDQQAPVVSITFPTDKAVSDVAVLDLEGTASDNSGAVASVSVKLNGGAASTVPVADGKFTVAIKLNPGANTVEVSATDTAGNMAKATATASFNAGISGVIHVADHEATFVADATVELLDPGTGARLVTGTSDAQGAFALNLTEVGRDVILVVKASGFMTQSETLSVPDDERLKLTIPLKRGQDALPVELAINFMEPTDGAVVSSEAVVVYGTVVGFDLTSITVNGVAGEQIGAGGFSATVPLVQGANVIEAIARGPAGESVSGKITVTRATASSGDTDPESPAPNQQVKNTGCAAVPGFELLALGALAALFRRRRSAALHSDR